MTRKELRNVVEKEYSDIRKWNKEDFGRYSKLMYDTCDGKVWADCFISGNDWKEYHSDTIYSVPIIDLIYENSGRRPMKISEIVDVITDYITERLDAGIIEN